MIDLDKLEQGIGDGIAMEVISVGFGIELLALVRAVRAAMEYRAHVFPMTDRPDEMAASDAYEIAFMPFYPQGGDS